MSSLRRLHLCAGVIMWSSLSVVLFLRICVNGAASFSPIPASQRPQEENSTVLVLSAVYPGQDGFYGQDEAFQIANPLTRSVVLTEAWQVMDENGHMLSFPSLGTVVPPRSTIWCARNALSFTLAFGFSPSVEYGEDSSADIPNMMAMEGQFELDDVGGYLALVRSVFVDSANLAGAAWPAGSDLSSERKSMERVDPLAPDHSTNWATAVSTTIGIDAGGQAIVGTPKHVNSAYVMGDEPAASPVVINEIAWAGTQASAYDEWIELLNNTGTDLHLNGWLLAAEDGVPSIRLRGNISARGFYLLERTDDAAVSNQAADQIYTGALENSGEALYLYQAEVVDALAYGQVESAYAGWEGLPLQLYDNGQFRLAGQIFFRKRDELTGWWLSDTDTAQDWANDGTENSTWIGYVGNKDLYGKRVTYPGWDWDIYTQTYVVSATGYVTVGIAPDNAYTVVAKLLSQARDTIRIHAYTFESVWLTDILMERIRHGVQVALLLDGSPAGGLPEQQLWNCDQIAGSGGQVYFMHNDRDAERYSRYANQHAKYMVVDDRWVLISSENFTNHSMPVDDKSNGTFGSRGVVLAIDQRDVAAYVRALFERDCDPANHKDVVRYGELGMYRVPPTYTAVYSPGGGGYEYMAPFSATVPAFSADRFEVIHAPEVALRYQDGLIGLLRQAGPGDSIWVEQMYERAHWGSVASQASTDPNPRLEAYIQAARNGAKVRILLDNGFDAERKNYETAFYLSDVARNEALDLAVRLGKPTGRGIHNKMLLVRFGDAKYVHVGSINGSEAASKVNRELALQIRSAQLYDYLERVFDYDWEHSAGPYEVRLPWVFCDYVPEAKHVAISEFVFKQGGTDELGEWIELYNPTAAQVDISGWFLGDAVGRKDYERLYKFPPGTAMLPGTTLIIARQAKAYGAAGYESAPWPDFELQDSDATPNLIRTSWGSGEFALGNAGDEVLLLDGAMNPVDVVTYGTGSYAGVLAFVGIDGVYNGESLERWPANRDSDDCGHDFRVRYLPEPGRVVSW